MDSLAVVRPSEWELPLFVHVLGAMLLVGGLVVVLAALAGARRTVDGEEAAAPLTRLGFRTALLVVVPAWLLMRVGGQWVSSEEFGEAEEPDWVGVGYTTADLGLPLVIATVALAAFASRRESRGAATAGAVTSAVLLLAYVVAVWAMTTKPG